MLTNSCAQTKKRGAQTRPNKFATLPFSHATNVFCYNFLPNKGVLSLRLRLIVLHQIFGNLHGIECCALANLVAA